MTVHVEPPVAASFAGVVSAESHLMGGRVGVHVRCGPDEAATATRAAGQVLGRLSAWAERLTRFSPGSDLSRLNGDPRGAVPVRPTLAEMLDWGRVAETLTDGIVDIALLDARLAAEADETGAEVGVDRLPEDGPSLASRSWSVERGVRTGVIRRPPGLRFDLDGVAKGWLADRAADLLAHWPGTIVDADGDLAVRARDDERWEIGVADPRGSELDLAVLALTGPGPFGGERRFGLATSGTSVHRWSGRDGVRHHLIDPRTGRPARTDVLQATVLAESARVAEAYAKTVVILGSDLGLTAMDRPDVAGVLVLTTRDELLTTTATGRWLA